MAFAENHVGARRIRITVNELFSTYYRSRFGVRFWIKRFNLYYIYRPQFTASILFTFHGVQISRGGSNFGERFRDYFSGRREDFSTFLFIPKFVRHSRRSPQTLKHLRMRSKGCSKASFSPFTNSFDKRQTEIYSRGHVLLPFHLEQDPIDKRWPK